MKYVVGAQCFLFEVKHVELLLYRHLVYCFSLRFIDVADYKDIVEEALDLFRGNVYFANFEIKGPADRLLVVLILYISRVQFYCFIWSYISA